MEISSIDLSAATIQKISNERTRAGQVNLSVLRLDKIHPVISGNKWFKLKYYLQDAMSRGIKSLLTFGGPYSNHIVATALASQLHGIKSVGIIRGEEPKVWSPSLVDAHGMGMELHFISREEFKSPNRDQLIHSFNRDNEPLLVVPEGGSGEAGVLGASEIWGLVEKSAYSHVMAAAGTGTTLAGLLRSAESGQSVIGISVMKDNLSLQNHIETLSGPDKKANFILNQNYHFGGYAKKNTELMQFMNELYKEHGLPTDFVYTGKLMYAVLDLINKNYFPPGSDILVIHSGGLQGNRSLAPRTLVY